MTNAYLRTRVMTASPPQLRLMLLEGATRFARCGSQALERGDREASYENLSRAQRIVLELGNAMDHAHAPDLCERLSALYTYIYRLLVDAGVEQRAAAADEAVELLEFERETWAMAMGRDAAEPIEAEAVARAVAGRLSRCA